VIPASEDWEIDDMSIAGLGPTLWRLLSDSSKYRRNYSEGRALPSTFTTVITM
jgi:hypothetical protein